MAPVGFVEAEEVDGAVAAGGAEQRRLHGGWRERQRVDGGRVGAAAEGERLGGLRQPVHAQHCSFRAGARQQSPVVVPAHCCLQQPQQSSHGVAPWASLDSRSLQLEVHRCPMTATCVQGDAPHHLGSVGGNLAEHVAAGSKEVVDAQRPIGSGGWERHQAWL